MQKYKKMLFVAALVAMVAVIGAVNGKPAKSRINSGIPDKDAVISMQQDEAAKILNGMSGAKLRNSWGSPDGKLTDPASEIWNAGEGQIIVYYDENDKISLIAMTAGAGSQAPSMNGGTQ